MFIKMRVRALQGFFTPLSQICVHFVLNKSTEGYFGISKYKILSS